MLIWGIGSACGLGASPTPDLRESAKKNCQRGHPAASSPRGGATEHLPKSGSRRAPPSRREVTGHSGWVCHCYTPGFSLVSASLLVGRLAPRTKKALPDPKEVLLERGTRNAAAGLLCMHKILVHASAGDHKNGNRDRSGKWVLVCTGYRNIIGAPRAFAIRGMNKRGRKNADILDFENIANTSTYNVSQPRRKMFQNIFKNIQTSSTSTYK